MGSLLTSGRLPFCFYTATAVSHKDSLLGILMAGMARYTYPRQRRVLCPFLLSYAKKRQTIYRNMSKNVKICQSNKNIENKQKYFKKCVDKCISL